MGISINKLTNANVYVDGGSLLGQTEEITLPSVMYKMAEHKALGMVGTTEFFSGIDKMETKIKWNSYYPEVMKKMANPFKNMKIQVRASLETYGADGRTEQVPCIVYITAASKGFPMGGYKQHENVEVENTLTTYQCKLEIDGEPIVEVDILNNIFKVEGEDLLAEYRANLGI